MRIFSLFLLSVPMVFMAEWTFSEGIHIMEFLVMVVTSVSAATMVIMASRQKAASALLQGQLEVLNTRFEALHDELVSVKKDLGNWREFCQSVQREKLGQHFQKIPPYKETL